MIASPARPAIALADALATAELDLDRLLTSFDVGYWRVRQGRNGLTLVQRVAHLTARNVLARRVASGQAGSEQLRDVGQSGPAATGRPAALLHSWRRSCADLRRAVPSVADAALRGWLTEHCRQLDDVTRELGEHYAHWLTCLKPRITNI